MNPAKIGSRISLTRPPRAVVGLQKIMEWTEAQTAVAAIRVALQAYMALLKAVRDGKEIILRSERADGTFEEIKMPPELLGIIDAEFYRVRSFPNEQMAAVLGLENEQQNCTEPNDLSEPVGSSNEQQHHSSPSGIN